MAQEGPSEIERPSFSRSGTQKRKRDKKVDPVRHGRAQFLDLCLLIHPTTWFPWEEASGHLGLPVGEHPVKLHLDGLHYSS